MSALDELLAASSGMISIAGSEMIPGSRPQFLTGATLADLLRGSTALAGADAALPSVDSQAVQAALAQRLMQNGLVVTQNRPTKARRFVLGFEFGPIAAGASAVITSRPQVPMRPERFTVPSDIAGSFTILDLRVGKNPQFASANPVPARMFQENATGIELLCDTAQISQDVTVSVQNIGGAPQTFRAALVGAALE